MTNIADRYDVLSKQDKLLVNSYIYLRASGLCLSCHNPDSDIHLNDHEGFCIDCSFLPDPKHISVFK
tara:strand:- start:2135 stop:2335 length:201 start_codon:yes stop_codon:yes gene_type:complete